jgi:cobaltochelatase CobT
MEKKTEIIENFKKAITSTIKSIIGDQHIEVIFNNEVNKKNKKTINLPSIEGVNNKIDYIKTRALADSEALRIKCSDINIYNSFEPRGNTSKLLYAVAEKIRYEKIGSSYFKGIKENLNYFYKIKSKKKIENKNNDYEFLDAFEYYLRSNISKFNKNKDSENKYKKYKKKLDAELKDKIEVLNKSLLDQKKFNSLISKIISQLKIEENIDPNNKENDQKDEDSLEDKAKSEDNQSSKEGENNQTSIDADLPDIEQVSPEIDKDIEVNEEEDLLNSPGNRKEANKNFETQNINLILKNLMKLLLQKNWRMKKNF